MRLEILQKQKSMSLIPNISIKIKKCNILTQPLSILNFKLQYFCNIGNIIVNLQFVMKDTITILIIIVHAWLYKAL